MRTRIRLSGTWVNAGSDIETPSRCIFRGRQGRTTMADDKAHPSDGTSGVTRRGLIKGIATAVTAASAGATALLVETRHELGAANASGPMPVSIAVNGVARTGSFEPRTTLAEALRDTWGLTGTKVGCDRGACGACTVLL